MGNKAFNFKQFKVEQDRCAMKIGTDAVLMGALLNLDSKCKTALEIGSGTGVISLMLAQRYPKLNIISLEIDPAAQEQCAQNFAQSPWKENLQSIEADFIQYTDTNKYDLIFSNPPFFSNSLLSDSEQRNLARHISPEQFQQWIAKAYELLNDNGALAFIIPSESVEFISTQLEGKMILEKNVFIRSFPDTEVIRNIVMFRKTNTLGSFEIKSLSIYESKEVYSREYEHALKHYLTIF